MFQHSGKEFQYSQNMFQKNRPARTRRGLPHRSSLHFFSPGEIPYICGKVLRPPPPHLIYAPEEPAPPPPPMLPQVVLPRDALLREVRRILPWNDARWKKVVVPRVTPPRVFYMPPLPLLALPPPRIPLLLPPPRKVTLSLPPMRIPLLLPPPPGRGFIIVGGVRPIRREVRCRRRDPRMLAFPRRIRLRQEPPPEHEIYREMTIKPPGKFLTILIILLTLPGWLMIWTLGGFTLRDLREKK